MRQEESMREYSRHFELDKLIGKDEWEQPEEIAGRLTERQVIPWIILGALIICFGNIVYAFIELLKEA